MNSLDSLKIYNYYSAKSAEIINSHFSNLSLYDIMNGQLTLTTEQPKEEAMTEFTAERRSLDTDLTVSFRNHEKTLRGHYHMDPIEPKSMKQVADLFAAGHYVKPEDKIWEREYRYDNPLHLFEFREHPADANGFDAALQKLTDKYSEIRLKAAVLPPADALKHNESFRTATFH